MRSFLGLWCRFHVTTVIYKETWDQEIFLCRQQICHFSLKNIMIQSLYLDLHLISFLGQKSCDLKFINLSIKWVSKLWFFVNTTKYINFMEGLMNPKIYGFLSSRKLRSCGWRCKGWGTPIFREVCIFCWQCQIWIFLLAAQEISCAASTCTLLWTFKYIASYQTLKMLHISFNSNIYVNSLHSFTKKREIRTEVNLLNAQDNTNIFKIHDLPNCYHNQRRQSK